MGIRNRDGALYVATGIDNSGFYAGKREAIGIIKAMMGEITSFDVFSGIGISAATAFAQAAKSSYDFEREFRKNMLEVATISTQVTDDMTGFMNQVMSITQEIPVIAPEAARALYQIVSAGHDGADGMRVLEVSARSAIGGMTDTATAADAITTLLNAYKLGAADAEKVSDQLFTTARLGKTTFGELGQSIAQVAPIAASYGVEMDQVLAAVATLTKSGVPTAQAMTQIRASIIGVSKVLGDGAFDIRTYQDALAEVADMAAGSESKLRGLIPEVEAVNGVLGMTGMKAHDAASHLAEMNASAGATEMAFKQMLDDVDKQMALLSNNIQAALRPTGQAILKNVSEAAKAINNGFETGNMENGLENMRKLLLGVAGAYLTYKSSAIGAFAVEALGSAKVAISNNLRLLQNQITGESILAKEKERVYQEAYNVSLEKTITEEQRAKLAKLDLKAGSQEYMRALADQASQEKRNADNLVESLTKQVAKGKERLASAGDNLEMSRKAVESAKAEMDAAIKANDSVAFEIAQTKLNSAAKREEAAMTNVSATKKKLSASESRLLTATTVAETAATRMNTATTAADTAMTNVATTAKSRLRIATMALWQAMKANPLGMILTMVSFATTAYMLFADKIKVAETAQDRLNKLNRAAAESMAAETAELNMLLSIAKNELAARSEREKAIKRLNEISPEYLGNLSLENIKTREATESIDAYTKAIGRNAKSKALMDEINPLYREQLRLERELYDLQKKLDDLRENKLNLSDEQLRYANLDISAQIKNKESQKGEVDKQIRDVLDMYNKELSNETRRDPVKVDIPVHIQIEAEQANLSALMSKKEEIEARIKEKKGKGSLVDALDLAELGTVNNELKKTSDLLASLGKETSGNAESEGSTILERKIDLTKKLSEAEANLRKLRDPGSKAKENDITEAENKVKEIKGKLEALTGVSEKEGDKLKDIQSELSRLILDNELKLQTERIVIEEDGRNKRIALAKQETKDTIAAIRKEKQEYQQKVKESKVKEDPSVIKTFDDREAVARKKEKTEIAKIDKEYAEEYKRRAKALTDIFLGEEERRLSAIKDRYDKEREWARKQLDGGGMTEKQYKDYIVRVDLSENKDNLNGLLAELNDFKQQELTLTKEWDAKIATANSQKNAAIANGDKEAEAVAADLVDRMAKAKGKALSSLNTQMLMQSSEWVRLFGNLDTLTVEELDRLITSIQDKIDEGSLNLNPVDLQILMDRLGSAKDRIAEINPFKALSGSMKEMRTAMSDLKKAEADGLTGEALDQYKTKVKQAGEGARKSIVAIADAYGEVREVMRSAGELITMVDEGLGETVNNAMSLADAVVNIGEVVANAVIAFANGMSTMESASVILLIIKAVILAVMAAISLFNGDKKHEKKIKDLQGEVDTLARAYDRLGEAIEDAYSTEKAALIDQESENLRKQNELIRQQIREEEEKKKSDKDKIQEWRDTVEDNEREIERNNTRRRAEAIMGTDIKTAIDDFADAYADAWSKGEKAAGKSANVVRNLIRTSIMDMLKNKLKPDVEAFMTDLSKFMSDGVIDATEQQAIDEWEKRLEDKADGILAGKEKWLKDEEDQEDGVSGQLQAAMTEGTASQLVGLWNSTAIDMRELRQVGMRTGETVSSILSEVREVIRQNALIEQHTRRGADNTDGLIDELRDGFTALDTRLSEIERNTKSSKSRG